jgi:NAD(P)-dependent dehydrogenase (short-subunit alcohol dehydrogenase family)
LKINGTAAIVTGGASGLGAATAHMLVSQGARVTIFDTAPAIGVEAEQAAGLRFAKVDVSDDRSVADGLAQAQQAQGVARILVNCAGIGPARKTVGREAQAHPLDMFRRTIDVNLVGSFNVLSKFAALLSQAQLIGEERGVIVLTASIAAFEGQVGQGAYAASKAGIVGMTLPIARDLAPHGIRVMTIAPGVFRTSMFASLPQSTQESLCKEIPFPNRAGLPVEFTELVASIIAIPMLNGETIRLDGATRMAPR